ncbi:NADP-dependent oxidoreductase domain-containing protein [Lipomyces arxii]|uniref:NADP-dependent oxidoreductase domain-containing protein n=1 Tax=Lipomyces arxii TaxID=56418 RepID=UPI0034CEF0CF
MNRAWLILRHIQPSTLNIRQLSTPANMSFTLPSGAIVPVPAFGSGTKWYKPGDPTINRAVVDAIVSAVKLGYRHIDCAEVYGTEGEVGVAIKECGVPREELFITGKIYQAIKDPRLALTETLKKMDTDYLDLYLIHCPFFDEKSHGISIPKAWEIISELKAEGKIKDIGVSNFAIADLELLADAEEKVAVNQIEFNAYLQDQTPGIVDYCHSKGIVLEAYTPLGPIAAKPGPLDPIIAKIAAKYGKDEGQILLRWVYQRNVLPITTSAKPARQASNKDIFGFELTAEEMSEINEFGSKKHYRSYWNAQMD